MQVAELQVAGCRVAGCSCWFVGCQFLVCWFVGWWFVGDVVGFLEVALRRYLTLNPFPEGEGLVPSLKRWLLPN